MKGFTFYRAYYNVISRIKKKQDREELAGAILEFVFEEKEPSGLSEVAEIAFESFRLSLEKSRKNGKNAEKKTQIEPKTNRNRIKNDCGSNAERDPKKEKKSPIKESNKEKYTPQERENAPLFIPPATPREEKSAEDLFFEKYPKYAKDRDRYEDRRFDYGLLLAEFERSAYLRSLYTLKQVAEQYRAIVLGSFRDETKTDGGKADVTNARAERERFYSVRRERAIDEAENLFGQFMKDEAFSETEKRLRTLPFELAKAEIELQKGEPKARERLETLTREEARLKRRRRSILEKNGRTEADLLPKWHCEKCRDTGYLSDGRACDCYSKRGRNGEI